MKKRFLCLCMLAITSTAYASDLEQHINQNSQIATHEKTNIGVNAKHWGMAKEIKGFNSTAWGWNTVIPRSGSEATAFGLETYAGGWASTAFGQMTRAVGKASTAWGDGTDANGDWSTAFGSGTEANGAGSTAFGFKATANGHSSTAIGSSITVNGYNSVGIGLRDYMFANGQLRPEAPILHESNTFAVMGGTVKICDENAVCIDDLQQKIAEQDQLIVELTENVNFLMSQRN